MKLASHENFNLEIRFIAELDFGKSLKLRKFEKIYSKFMYENINEKQAMIEKICKSFDDEDRLKLVELYVTIFQIQNFLSENH